MTPEIHRADPPYLQIVDHIRRQILAGDLKDGDRIPPIRQIMDDWGVANATATKALAVLRSEGLARAEVGIGTVVSTTQIQQAARDRILAIRRSGRIYPPNEYARIKLAELTDAPPQVADALGIAAGDSVICRQRVTYQRRDDGADVPVSASTSWFRGDLAATAPDLLVAERLPQGTPNYIRETTGRTVSGARDQLAAGATTESHAEDLGVAPGSPVHLGRNWFYDQDGEVIEYGESVSVAGRWKSYEYTVTAEEG